ncbi:MAG: hypothetical protein ABIZ91_18775 [Gemmatimonadaceae bacterium]
MPDVVPATGRTRAGDMSLRRAGALALAFLVGCSAGESYPRDSTVARGPGDAAREFAIAVDKDRPRLAKKEWTLVAGDSEVTLTSFADGDTLRLIRERVNLEDKERTASRYYFDGARLRYFESDRDVMTTDAGAKSAVRKDRLVLAFDARGATVEATHTRDGKRAPLDSVTVDGVQARSREVARAWAAAPAAPKP